MFERSLEGFMTMGQMYPIEKKTDATVTLRKDIWRLHSYEVKRVQQTGCTSVICFTFFKNAATIVLHGPFWGGGGKFSSELTSPKST